MRKRRYGFTLIELMVALVLTGIVSLIAYGSIQAGIDSTDRLAMQRQTVESEALVRVMVSDALRHPADSPDGNPAFELLSFAGNRGDGIQFVTRGVSGVPGAGQLWRVALRPSASGVELEAISLESAASIRTHLPNLSSIDVRVLRAVDDMAWQDRWQSTQQFPAVVEISFNDLFGKSGPPFIVQTGLGER
ncbi:MAG TPA: prepilin-type N-terminal cleavage/methylation domain-containing protein [Gemmatimonadaceae bacterium]|nr:prepilin-type N-terminal cleavage/methylation domain-containing protein [Gemmatimonadaceae bacterium]